MSLKLEFIFMFICRRKQIFIFLLTTQNKNRRKTFLKVFEFLFFPVVKKRELGT